MMKFFPAVGINPEFRTYDCSIKCDLGYITISICQSNGTISIEQKNCAGVEDSVIIAKTQHLFDLKDALDEAIKVARFEGIYE